MDPRHVPNNFRLEIIDYKILPIAKKLNIFGRVKKYFTVILNITSTRIYDDIVMHLVVYNECGGVNRVICMNDEYLAMKVRNMSAPAKGRLPCMA